MKTNETLAALILAAGTSSRMGDWKPLLPMGRTTLLEEAVRRFRAAGIHDIRVVTGHRAEELVPVLDRLAVRHVFNPDYPRGMFSSVRAGCASFGAGTEAFFLLPVDIPLVRPETIAALARAYRTSGAPIIYPRFEGLRGHPPLIATSCVRDLPKECEGGFRAYLNRYEDHALDLDVIDERILMDCDTPEDYHRLQACRCREDLPSRREWRALRTRFGLSENLIAHCRLVAELARILAVHLNRTGLNLDLGLIVAAGSLHDLAKGQPDHAGAGARILRELGYPRVAEIVASHMDIDCRDRSLDESHLIYLADKCVDEDLLISLEERFQRSFERFAGNPDILRAVARRLKNAITIKERIENILRMDFEQIVAKHGRALHAAASSGKRTVYLARHGAVELQKAGKCYIGQLDLALSSEGFRQARALEARLRSVPLSAIYCSDLKRSVETAEIVAAPHGLRPRVREDLREIGLGAWEGLTFDTVRERYPEEYEERGRDKLHYCTPGGESFLECTCRVIPALYAILHATRGDILIVGHAGVNRILLCQAMGKPLEHLFEIEQAYGCLNRIETGDYAFEVKSLNEVGFGGKWAESGRPTGTHRAGNRENDPFLRGPS